MDKSKGVHKLKDQIDEVQTPIPVISGMKAKEIGVLLLILIIVGVGFMLFKMV